MRRLASELGVEAMSLYLHVRNKDAILTGVLDRLFAEVEAAYLEREAASAGSSWRDRLRTLAQCYYDVMLLHQRTAPLLVQVGQTPRRLAFMNTLLGILRDGGLDSSSAHRAMHLVQNHLVGHALRSHTVSLRGRHEVRERAREAAAAADLRYVAELDDLAECETAGAFPLGVDVLIAGIEGTLLHAAAHGGAAAPQA